MKASPRRTWPFSVAGAVMLFAVVGFSKTGQDEAVNAIVILGSLAALSGAVLGSVVGGAVNRREAAVAAVTPCGRDRPPASSKGRQ